MVVEWTAANGSKRSGLLHVSEMRTPAAKAEAELGVSAAAAAAEEEGEEGGLLADEGEYGAELYVDVGGVDKPSTYYKVGNKPGDARARCGQGSLAGRRFMPAWGVCALGAFTTSTRGSCPCAQSGPMLVAHRLRAAWPMAALFILQLGHVQP